MSMRKGGGREGVGGGWKEKGWEERVEKVEGGIRGRMRQEMESINPLDLSPPGPLHSQQRYSKEFQQFWQYLANNICRYIRTKFVKNIARDALRQCFWVILIFGANTTETFRRTSTFNVGLSMEIYIYKVFIEINGSLKVVSAIQLEVYVTYIKTFVNLDLIMNSMTMKRFTWGEDGVLGDNLLLARFLIIERRESADEILFNFRWLVWSSFSKHILSKCFFSNILSKYLRLV